MLVTTKTLIKGNNHELQITINERNELEILLKENYKMMKIVEILEKDRVVYWEELKE